MAVYFIVPLMALVGGVVQGVTGFGCGIIMMMAFPFLFETMPIAAGVSCACGICLTFSMVIKLRKDIEIKKVILPGIIFMAVSTAGIFISTSLNQTVMKKAFGIFLIVLCIYYLFFNKPSEKPLNPVVALLFIVISAVCDSFFGIGGPLMVLYFMAQIKDMTRYRATIQTFFFIVGVYGVIVRIVRGIITVNLVPFIALGAAGIILGGLVGNRIADKLNPDIVRKCTYVMIGVAGLVNVI